jgi:hypothetical protein
MKVTVDLSQNDMDDIKRFSGERKKRNALEKFLAVELMLRRRRELSDEVMSGEFRVEFPEFRWWDCIVGDLGDIFV